MEPLTPAQEVHERDSIFWKALLFWLLGSAPVVALGCLAWMFFESTFNIFSLEMLSVAFLCLMCTSPLYFVASWWLGQKSQDLRQRQTTWEKVPGQLNRSLSQKSWKLFALAIPGVMSLLLLWVGWPTSGFFILIEQWPFFVMGWVSLSLAGLYMLMASKEVRVAAAHDQEVLRERREHDQSELVGGLDMALPTTTGDLSVSVDAGALAVHEEMYFEHASPDAEEAQDVCVEVEKQAT